VHKAHLPRERAESVKLLGRNELDNRQMLTRRLQVLAQGEDIAPGAAEIS
jgi:hypothetical protein